MLRKSPKCQGPSAMDIRIGNNMASSVAGGGFPPIGLSTKMQNKKNTTFLALLRLSFALELTKK